jgi:tRNA A-37 threonylcarbamoyl transferase component Bud32
MIAREDAALSPGATVGGYRVEGPIGAGGMGAVYAAVEPTIGKRVAIKVLRRELTSDPRFAMRFEREAKAVGRVRHPAVVEVFAYGALEDGRPYFVMPLYPGKSVREVLDAKGPFSPAEAWRIAREVAEGLLAAHREGVLHRDLKPDNVLLVDVPGRAAQPVVVDFGLAKLAEHDASDPDAEKEKEKDLTGTQGAMGTPAYMAPEQWWSRPATARTDQYAFGALVFELCAGRPPFVSQKLPELLQLHLHEPPPSLGTVGATVPADADAFVARLMSKEPDDRFPSLAEAVEEGDRVFSGKLPSGDAKPLDVHAPTEVASTRLERVLQDSRAAASLRSDVLPRAGVTGAALGLALGTAAFSAGYAGAARYRPIEVFHNAGFGAIVSTVLGLVGAGIVGHTVARGRSTSRLALALGAATLPGATGIFMTYLGWQIVLANAFKGTNALAFEIIHAGYYEASAARFIGLGLTTMLALALAYGLSGVPPAGRAHTPTLAGAGALAALAALEIVVGAPSAAVVLFVTAAAVAAVSRARPHPSSPELAPYHVLAAVVATLATAGMAYTRVEARGAALWFAGATRADRVAEIVGAAHERSYTLTAIAGSLVAVVVAALASLGRSQSARATRPELRKPALGAALYAGTLLLVVGLDVYFVADFRARRQELVRTMSEQFALFSQLTPPSLGDRPLPLPTEAPALQITKDSVAVNGKGAARLAALDSPGGRQSLTNEVTTALAAPVTRGDRAVDLSILVDQHAPWSRVVELLTIARDSGASNAELLLTRGTTPAIPAMAPPEAGALLPSDFGALRVSLGSAGLRFDKEKDFGTVAEELLLESAKRDDRVSLDLGARP